MLGDKNKKEEEEMKKKDRSSSRNNKNNHKSSINTHKIYKKIRTLYTVFSCQKKT